MFKSDELGCCIVTSDITHTLHKHGIAVNFFYLPGAFNVTFRTGESTRGGGFVIFIICFDPLELDFPGKQLSMTI